MVWPAISHPVTLPFVWRELGTPGWDCPTGHHSRSPRHFALPLRDPKNTSEEISARMSSGQGKPRGWFCLLCHFLCSNPKPLAPYIVLPTRTWPPLLQNQVAWANTVTGSLSIPAHRDAVTFEHHPRADNHPGHPPPPRDSKEPHCDHQPWMLARSLGGRVAEEDAARLQGASRDEVARLAGCRRDAHLRRFEANSLNQLRRDYYAQTTCEKCTKTVIPIYMYIH